MNMENSPVARTNNGGTKTFIAPAVVTSVGEAVVTPHTEN